MSDPVLFETPPGPFDAITTVPGDKSLGHRALILAGMARGRSRVAGLSDGADIASTQAVLARLGVGSDADTVVSPGFAEWSAPSAPLDCGNSGTTMRLMTGALSASHLAATLVGDASLSRRPMRRLLGPLGALGATITLSDHGTAPIAIQGQELTGAVVDIPVASAQVRTAVALAALHADGPTTIDSPDGFRDHTERWLASLGLAERVSPTRLVVRPGAPAPLDVAIPGDPSSAAFLWAAAAICPGSRITTTGVSLNPGRLGFLRILSSMGATVALEERDDVLGDPVGDVTVAAAPLRGVDISGSTVAAAIDELPLLAVVAAHADGSTTVRDAAELRIKESDRLAAAVALARVAGGSARIQGDGFVVERGTGGEANGIDADGDHRVAMAAAVASIGAGRPVEITGFDACAVSWPGFPSAVEALWS